MGVCHTLAFLGKRNRGPGTAPCPCVLDHLVVYTEQSEARQQDSHKPNTPTMHRRKTAEQSIQTTSQRSNLPESCCASRAGKRDKRGETFDIHVVKMHAVCSQPIAQV